MAMKPAYKPELPFSADINGMFVEKSIHVFGRAHNDPVRFHINLVTKDGKIALHFNPRFREHIVVRNTYNGEWGQEERTGTFLFSAGNNFSVELHCHETFFQMKVNNKLFGRYNHRLPYGGIKAVEVAGDCDVIMVRSTIADVELPALMLSKPDSKVGIPFFNLKHHSVIIVGRPTNKDGRFTVDFVDEYSKRIFFHFNPRMNEQSIVRNTKAEKGWGHEERALEMPFPFAQHIPFVLKFSVQKNQFHVTLNGWNLLTYSHRIKRLKQIREIQVHGDVEVMEMKFV